MTGTLTVSSQALRHVVDGIVREVPGATGLARSWVPTRRAVELDRVDGDGGGLDVQVRIGADWSVAAAEVGGAVVDAIRTRLPALTGFAVHRVEVRVADFRRRGAGRVQ